MIYNNKHKKIDNLTWEEKFMRLAGKNPAWMLVTLAVLLVLAACGGGNTAKQANGSSNSNGGGQPKELVKWTHGVIIPRADSAYQFMAKEKELFKKYGVDIEYKEFDGDVALLQALLAGQLDSIEANPASTLAAVQQGAKVKFIGSTLSANPFVLYTKGSIKSFADLKGKTIGVTAPGSMPDMTTKAMLKANGVDLDSVNFVVSGTDAQRYQALVAGKIDATAGNSDYVTNAASDGVNVLGYASDIIPNYPRFVVIANESSLKQRPQGAIGFLAAQIEGLTYALEHRDEALALAAKTMKLPKDSPVIAQVYDEFKNKNYVSPKVEIPVEKIEWLQNLMIELGRMTSKVDINSLIDQSYREEALKLANVK
jgi:ABC-type nitrate/sulfonate/bicarbonate transport system substrate-binding protein